MTPANADPAFVILSCLFFIAWGISGVLYAYRSRDVGSLAIGFGNSVLVWYVTTMVTESNCQFWRSFEIISNVQTISVLKQRAIALPPVSDSAELPDDPAAHSEADPAAHSEADPDLDESPEALELQSLNQQVKGLAKFWAAEATAGVEASDDRQQQLEAKASDPARAALLLRRRVNLRGTLQRERERAGRCQCRSLVRRKAWVLAERRLQEDQNRRVAFFQLLVILSAQEAALVRLNQIKSFLTSHHKHEYQTFSLTEFKRWVQVSMPLVVEMKAYFAELKLAKETQDQQIAVASMIWNKRLADSDPRASPKLQVAFTEEAQRVFKVSLRLRCLETHDCACVNVYTCVEKLSVASARKPDITGWNYQARAEKSGLCDVEISGERKESVMQVWLVWVLPL